MKKSLLNERKKELLSIMIRKANDLGNNQMIRLTAENSEPWFIFNRDNNFYVGYDTKDVNGKHFFFDGRDSFNLVFFKGTDNETNFTIQKLKLRPIAK